MKVTDVRAEVYRWPRRTPITNGLYTYTHSGINAVFVETDEGVTGVGLGSGIQDAPEVGVAILEHLKQHIIGKDPLDIERHWHEMWRPKLVGRRGITTRVLSGIDIASGTSRRRSLECRCTSYWVDSPTQWTRTSRVAITKKEKVSANWLSKWSATSSSGPQP